MKYLPLIVWMIVTLLLCLSIVGLLVVLKHNSTMYFREEHEMRSSWMVLGFQLFEHTKN